MALVVGAAVGLHFSGYNQVEGTWVKRGIYSPTIYLEVTPEKVNYYWVDHTCSTGNFRVDTLLSNRVTFGDYCATSKARGRLVVTRGHNIAEYRRTNTNASRLCREINTRKTTLSRWGNRNWTGIHPDIVSGE